MEATQGQTLVFIQVSGPHPHHSTLRDNPKGAPGKLLRIFLSPWTNPAHIIPGTWGWESHLKAWHSCTAKTNLGLSLGGHLPLGLGAWQGGPESMLVSLPLELA